MAFPTDHCTIHTQLKYSNTSVLVSFITQQTLHLLYFDKEKNGSALSTLLGLITLDRSYMSHDAVSKEKKLHSSVLIGFRTHHEFWNKLQRVPRYHCPSVSIFPYIDQSNNNSALMSLFTSLFTVLIMTIGPKILACIS